MFERLYNEKDEKKSKQQKLLEKVNKQEGWVFKPKTNQNKNKQMVNTKRPTAKYSSGRLNKMQSQNSRESSKQRLSFTFCPEISSESRKLAQKHRKFASIPTYNHFVPFSKIPKPKIHKNDASEKLYMEQYTKELDQEALKLKGEQTSMQNCTFTPTISARYK